ncbi:MAG TPA: Hsp20/alpha crystallin family protein [Bryobacteraceae bacterium]|nr:Hsp20/alpha crystallin family protein [Bryobacteraceae bacterium]
MSKVEIRKLDKDNKESLLASVENLFGRIKERAYSLFEKREWADGRDLDDWLSAERELLWSPPAELTETENEFHLLVAVPGFEEKEIEVTATPETVIVKAKASTGTEKEKEDTVFSEFAERTLLRRIDLPVPIDLDHTNATLGKGVLKIVAKKAALPETVKPEAEKKVEAKEGKKIAVAA